MASSFTVKIANNNVEDVLAAMNAQAVAALESIGQEAEGFAKEDCPVDTSRLRNSIAHAVDGEVKELFVGTNVEYAPYVEYNEKARHDPPEFGGGKAHFLRDSVANHADYYKSILEAALND